MDSSAPCDVSWSCCHLGVHGDGVSQMAALMATVGAGFWLGVLLGLLTKGLKSVAYEPYHVAAQASANFVA